MTSVSLTMKLDTVPMQKFIEMATATLNAAKAAQVDDATMNELKSAINAVIETTEATEGGRRMWKPYSEAPEGIRQYVLGNPRLGEHVCRSTTMANEDVLIVCFHPMEHDPQFYAVLPPIPYRATH